MRHVNAISLAVALVAAPLASAPVLAQQVHGFGRAASIGSLQLSTDAGLRPGSLLSFRLEGSPGARGQITVGQDGPQVQLREASPGVYVGRYVVPRSEPVEPDAELAASLDYDGHSTSTRFRMPPSLASANGFTTATARPSKASDSREAQASRRQGPLLVPPSSDTSRATVLGSAPAALPLQLNLPDARALTEQGKLDLTGTTAPLAQVRVRVDAVPRTDAGSYVVAQQLASHMVQSDRDGRFHVQVEPGQLPPGTRYRVQVTADIGTETAERVLTIQPGS